jgi:hypothetical protein
MTERAPEEASCVCVSLSVRERTEVDWARERRLLAPEHELDALNLARSELLLVEHRAESTRSIQKSLHKRLVCPCLLALVSFPVSRREEHYSALEMACWPTAPFFGVFGWMGACSLSQGVHAGARCLTKAAWCQEILRRLTEAAKDAPGVAAQQDALRKMVSPPSPPRHPRPPPPALPWPQSLPDSSSSSALAPRIET